MKSKLFIAIIGTMVLVLGAAQAGLCGEADRVASSERYGAFVDKYIKKCASKAEMLDSDSFNIRKNAMRATVKGAFLQSNRTTMINYLAEKNVPMNPDRIEYHLNQKFAEAVLLQGVYAALTQDHVNR